MTTRVVTDEQLGVLARHLIDCDAPPTIPNGWTVEEHRKGGQWRWDPSQVKLYLTPRQVQGKVIEGHDLRKELKDKPVLSANVLDYLLAHQELIPESWKGQYVFFWGTIYRNSDGDLCVRCLYWRGGGWRWGCDWLGNVWVSGYPAAVRAS